MGGGTARAVIQHQRIRNLRKSKRKIGRVARGRTAGRARDDPNREQFPAAGHAPRAALAIREVGRLNLVGLTRIRTAARIPNQHVERGRHHTTARSRHNIRPHHRVAHFHATRRNTADGQIGVHREQVGHRDGFAPREVRIGQFDPHGEETVISVHIRRHNLGDAGTGWAVHDDRQY